MNSQATSTTYTVQHLPQQPTAAGQAPHQPAGQQATQAGGPTSSGATPLPIDEQFTQACTAWDHEEAATAEELTARKEVTFQFSSAIRFPSAELNLKQLQPSPLAGVPDSLGALFADKLLAREPKPLHVELPANMPGVPGWLQRLVEPRSTIEPGATAPLHAVEAAMAVARKAAFFDLMEIHGFKCKSTSLAPANPPTLQGKLVVIADFHALHAWHNGLGAFLRARQPGEAVLLEQSAAKALGLELGADVRVVDMDAAHADAARALQAFFGAIRDAVAVCATHGAELNISAQQWNALHASMVTSLDKEVVAYALLTISKATIHWKLPLPGPVFEALTRIYDTDQVQASKYLAINAGREALMFQCAGSELKRLQSAPHDTVYLMAGMTHTENLRPQLGGTEDVLYVEPPMANYQRGRVTQISIETFARASGFKGYLERSKSAQS